MKSEKKKPGYDAIIPGLFVQANALRRLWLNWLLVSNAVRCPCLFALQPSDNLIDRLVACGKSLE